MIPAGVTTYVVGALVAIAALVGAHEVGYGRAAKVGKAQLVAYQAEAKAESEKLKAKSAEVRVEVVTEYVDRIKEVRKTETVEVVREIEVIRQSDCKLPANWVRLHNSPEGGSPDPAPGVDDPGEVSCAVAIETVRENYKRFLENAAQLSALQKWAAAVSTP